MKKLYILAAIGATAMSTQALAQEANGDMTRQQAEQMAAQMFNRFDVNHDGVVTRQEAEQARQQMGFGGARAEKLIDRIFGTAQSLTLQQFEAQQLARFDRDDANHDGIVTAAERQAARAKLKADRAAAEAAAPKQ